MEYNNIQPEGFAILADVFQENIISQNSKIVNSLISTTLRILILDNNSLGEKGALRISSFLDNCKCLIMLSLANNNIGLAGSEAIAKALTTNMHLKYLSLAFNPLDNYGVTKLAKSLRANKYLETLDLFDVYFNDEGCVALSDALAVNTHLRILILANTEVKKRNATILTNTATGSKSLRILRWSNLKDLPDEPLRMSINKLIIVEKTSAPISRIPLKCGLFHQELLMDVLKFQLPVFFDFNILKVHDEKEDEHHEAEEDPTKRVMKKMANITNELVQQEFERQHELFRSYFTFILQYWDVLKRGDLHNISDRPDKSFKFYRKNEDLDRVLDEIKTCIPSTQADDWDEPMKELKKKAGVKIFNSEVDLVSWNEQYYKLRSAQTKFSAHALFIDLKYYGFEPDKPDAEGISATAECVVYGNVEVFQMLMENKVNTNQIHNQKGSHFEGFTLYHFAVLSKTVDMIKYLLENKVLLGLEIYINQRNAQGDTAGQLAVRLNKLEHARILKEYGCETAIQGNEDGLTQVSQQRNRMLSIEIAPKDPEMMKKLEREMEAHRISSKNPLITKPNSLRLIDSIIWNDEEAFMQIITQKYNLNERDADNMTALHHALFNMKEHFAAALIERGCDVNIKDKKGMTPLHVAALRCSPDICRALLAHSADINAVNNDGNTPMHLAAKRGRSTVVRLLVEWNADPHIFNLAQRTPAQYCDEEDIRRFIMLHEKAYSNKKKPK